MKAHFFDLDTILTTDNKVWLVDKTIPNIPIMKISQSDFNLIKNEILYIKISFQKLPAKTSRLLSVLYVTLSHYRSDLAAPHFLL